MEQSETSGLYTQVLSHVFSGMLPPSMLSGVGGGGSVVIGVVASGSEKFMMF
jgi:hypothetical protein